jgi:hypothetical protein
MHVEAGGGGSYLYGVAALLLATANLNAAKTLLVTIKRN